MNEPFDFREDEQPSSDGLPLPIEQQLQAFRPRAPRVDWDAISASTVHTLPTPPNQSGFTVRQLTLAVAASWLLGALVGGGCIFWSMSHQAKLQSQPTIVQANNEEPSDKPAQPGSATDQREPASPRSSSEITAAPFNLTDASWLSDEPLGVRSLSSTKPQRLTALRTTASPANNDAANNDPVSNTSSSQSFEPASMSNRQQLMHQYLKNSDQLVY